MKSLQIAVLLAFFSMASSFSAFAQKMKPGEILAKHLDSIGTPAVRAADKTRGRRHSTKPKYHFNHS